MDPSGLHTFIVSRAPNSDTDDSVFWNGTYAGVNPKDNPDIPISTMSRGIQNARNRYPFQDPESGVEYSDNSSGRYVKIPTISEANDPVSIEMFVPKKEMGNFKESLDSFLQSSGHKVSDSAYNAAINPPKPKSFLDRAKSAFNQIPLGPATATSWLGRHSYALGAGAIGLLGLTLYLRRQEKKRQEEMQARLNQLLMMRRFQNPYMMPQAFPTRYPQYY